MKGPIDFFKMLGEKIENAFSAMGDFFEYIGTKMVDFFESVWRFVRKIARIIGDFFKKVIYILGRVAVILGKIVVNVAIVLGWFLVVVVLKFIMFFVGLVRLIILIVQKAAGSIANSMQNPTQSNQEENELYDTTTETINNAEKNRPQIDPMLKILMGISEIPFMEVFNQVKKIFVYIFTVVASKVITGFISGIKSIVNTIVNIITAIPCALLEMIKGLIDGIASWVDKIPGANTFNFIDSIISGFKSWYKNTLDESNSNSTIMKWGCRSGPDISVLIPQIEQISSEHDSIKILITDTLVNNIDNTIEHLQKPENQKTFSKLFTMPNFRYKTPGLFYEVEELKNFNIRSKYPFEKNTTIKNKKSYKIISAFPFLGLKTDLHTILHTYQKEQISNLPLLDFNIKNKICFI